MVGLSQVGIRTHAAIGMAAAEILRSMDRPGRGRLRQGALGGHQRGLQVEGEGNLAGGGVVTLPIAVELPGQPHHRRGGEPVRQPTAQLSSHRQSPGGRGAVGLGKGGPGGGDVATVAIHHVDALKAMAGQGEHHVVEHRQQGGGLQAHRAGEAEMVFGHPEGLGRDHEDAAAAPQLQGHRLGGEGIGADRPGGAMLLSGAQGHDHALAGVQVALHLRPGAQLQADGLQRQGLGREGAAGGRFGVQGVAWSGWCSHGGRGRHACDARWCQRP